MDKLKTIGSYTLQGLIGGPILGLLFCTFTAGSCDMAGLKSAFYANLLWAAILIPIGTIIGFFVGVYKVVTNQA